MVSLAINPHEWTIPAPLVRLLNNLVTVVLADVLLDSLKRLGVGRTLMYTLVKDGEVESVQIGRLRRIPADALFRYLEQLRAALPQPHDSAA